jgi:hypothetical protein
VTHKNEGVRQTAEALTKSFTTIVELFSWVVWNVLPDDNCHVAVALLEFV